ncbi:MAG: hypothetical protein WAP52_02415 [Candidatus Sungiibacteriota bacterium]
MTLAVHALIGAATAHQLGLHNPLSLFLAGAATHYLSDAIPHWDWRLFSFSSEEKSETRRWKFASAIFARDIAYVVLDGVLGIAAVLLIAQPSSVETAALLLLAALGGMTPDLLQGIYFTGYAPYLMPLQRFHDFCHTKIKLGPYPAIGIPFQILIALVAAYLLM